MILSDNETKVDLLNNKAIAKTIVSIIKDSKESVSTGVHGDWGAGKSSILAMVEEEVAEVAKKKEEKPFRATCVHFNGWQHQGFENSKIALMSAIVSQLVELAEKHPVKEETQKVKDIAKNLWKNINWLSVAKQVGAVGFSLATGTAPITILTKTFELLKGHADSQEHVEAAIGTIGEYIKKAAVSEDTSTLKEFNEFRKNFKELLKEAEIEKLVVIIDDLDRCLPTVAVETLEAVRMFMFMEETAFVIGADEIMIRYAVKKHFPDMEREKGVNIGVDFASKYLEKLIQVPFRIPALGPVESQLYTTLLLIGSKTDVPEKSYNVLVNVSLEKLKKPWDISPFNISDVQKTLGADNYRLVTDETLIALQISPILYQYSRGNPRVIKRFVNMLLLRYAVAENRGYGKNIDLKVLAKLMLAEYKWPNLYEKIAFHLVNGRSPELAYFEEKYNESEEAAVEDVEGSKTKKQTATVAKQSESQEKTKSKKKKLEATPKDSDWISSDEYRDWIVSKPELKGVDLRPYYAACKEKQDLFGRIESDELLSEAVDVLMKDEAILAGAVDTVKGLSEENASKAFEIVATNISMAGDFSEEPIGFAGLKVLSETHASLRKSLVDFVSALPLGSVGEWIITGWEKAIPTGSEERKQLESFFDRLLEDGSEWVKTALKTKRV